MSKHEKVRTFEKLKPSLITFAVFVLWTLLIKFFDVQEIGPRNSKVGFAFLNKSINKLIGYHKFMDQLSDLMGYLAIMIAAAFAVYGLYQLIKKKSFRKVDSDILVLGCLYALTICFYMLFQVLIINYRPVIVDGELEASYPSSHTMLAIVVYLSAIPEVNRHFKKFKLKQALNILLIAMFFIAVLSRIFSGVHWITDTIGGLILAFSLVSAFTELSKMAIKKKNAIKK